MPETSLLARLLRPAELAVAFQPVIDASGPVLSEHYLEGLIRGPRGTSLESPDILFEYARRKRSLAPVDRACIDAILAAARALPGVPRLGINVHAPTLALDAGFVDFLRESLAANGFAPPRVVVEIVEHAPPWDVAAFRRALADLRALGIRIALDDIGLGQSNYMMMIECNPDYFKLDRYFVTGSQADSRRRAVLRSVADLARHFGSQVVAEGVETLEDLKVVRDAGIGLVQGWLFGQARLASAPLRRKEGSLPGQVEAQPLRIGIDACSKLALYTAFLRRRGYRLADTPGSECAALVVCAEHALDQAIASWSHVIQGPKFVLAGDPPAGWRRAQRIDTPLLPLHLEQRILAACQANGHQPRPAKTYDVVVVDDDATIRAAAAEVFGALGLNVRGASGFAELTGAFFEGRPDFIVLDLNLPGISGRSLGNIIRGRSIPTALFSSAPPEDVERVREEIGAVKAFPKTTSLATMGQWILRFLVEHVR